jgi:hypothetical protein
LGQMAVSEFINRPVSRVTTTVVWVGVIAALVIALLYHDAISSWWFLRTYSPPAQIAQLADQSQMTDTGRNVFYRAAPQIITQRADMVSHCSLTDNQVAELGCYTSNEHIYLLNITEPALSQEMIVTAAYEMLHPVYEQMSGSQRQAIDSALETEAAKLTDENILNQVQIYAQTEPGSRDEELYSIFGTEATPTSAVLTASYSQYLSNPAQLVAYHHHFEQTYDGLGTAITALSEQINATKAIMQRYQAEGEIERYNELVPQVNNQVATYNAQVAEYNRYGNDLFGQQSTAPTQ